MPRLDLPILKSRLPISTVLRAHGHTPRANRMPCPLHHGDNRSAFSIKPGDQYARCWACGWHGDVIALEHALGGGTMGDAMARCAALAGLREPKPWERKPWLDKQRRQAEARRREYGLLWRQWEQDWQRMLVGALNEAWDEREQTGAYLDRHPDDDGAWRWVERACLEHDQAEWALVAEWHAATVRRCGEAVSGGRETHQS